MPANPLPTPESHSLKLKELSLDNLARLVGANVVRRNGDAYLANQSEIDLYRSDPYLEATRALPIVICRACGQICIVITTNHLRRHNLSRETYGDDQHWPGAPLISSVYRKVRSDAGVLRWTPERKNGQSSKMTDHWAGLTPEERGQWITNSKDALNTPEGKQAISDGTKEAYKRPEVKKNLSEGLKNKAWRAKGNEQRREQARKRANEIFKDPEVMERQKVGHAKPETRAKIGDATVRSFEEDPERGKKVSKRKKQWWEEQNRKLAEAERILAQRTPEEMTKAARLIVAAGLELSQTKQYKISFQLFAEQHVRRCAVDNTKKFFRRNRAEIEIEKARLANLSNADRTAAIQAAIDYLARQIPTQLTPAI